MASADRAHEQRVLDLQIVGLDGEGPPANSVGRRS